MGTCGGGVEAEVHRGGVGGFAFLAGGLRRGLVGHLVAVGHRSRSENEIEMKSL